ncbi:uncharacterized protein MKK02DRAFT_38911 [Dioszegia hungarica]|uniref:Uncharacterized protein n=1 Tax=Dioszegia hungarica TaxID=4972 RepID=A0AA38H5R9_9TREE|nr:uncharacterized protein MKK02DRAFT_38911 [Dioszegia hungarica]KAI9634237.1 hypothetical protein MKK02DRAFT_38911 [Dioszegia hungarica]
MNQTIDIAKAEFSKLQSGNGDAQVDSSAQGNDEAPSVSAYGQPGQAGQYGQEGQYGAVRGAGFGGGLAKGSDGQPQGQGQQQGERKHRASIYEGMEQDDSTSTGGYGRNAKGSSFSRANQMGTDESPAVFGDDDEDDSHGQGYKTGTSTPGYRQEGDVDHEAAENRIKNQNVYGQQADDRGAKGNDYNEAADSSPRI